jgi:hypothetical protein
MTTQGEQGAPVRVTIEAAAVALEGELQLPAKATGIVVFPHHSGLPRPARDADIAQQLGGAGVATLLVHLLSSEEQTLDARMACFRFDSKMLSDRLTVITDWLGKDAMTCGLPIGYFSAGGSGSAALAAALARPKAVCAVVLYNSRPDLINVSVARLTTPTLILVGGDEPPELGQNQVLLEQLGAPDKQLMFVPLAAERSDQPAGLEGATRVAADWYRKHDGRVQQPGA